MNYAAHYDRLIGRARGRVFVGYRERHHVIPRCMGGGNEKENIVELTGEEHYVAHQLLVKMYPAVRGLATAAFRMAKQCTGNKAYGWLRRRHADAARGNKHSIGKKFRKRTPEELVRMSQRMLSNPNMPAQIEKMRQGNLGRKHTPEHRYKAGSSKRGKTASDETKERMRIGRTGIKHSLETRLRISELNRGRPCSQETRAKLSAARKRYFSNEDARKRHSQSLRGRQFSAEHRAKISEAAKRREQNRRIANGRI